jgi:hypothetical protein
LFLFKKVLFLYKQNKKTMETLSIKKQKLSFGKGNEVTGWYKTIDGKKVEFTITNDGELKQTDKDVHPFLMGLYEMLFSND